ncbi:MAG: phosphoenolpyruvate synthase, partial [Gillisia sp.]|nr:phosphoenolpyruvate synthase [Gillisia sp.]
MEVLIKKFKEIGMKDLPLVGGKNASLGEMYNELTSKGIQIPNGFATTSNAFWKFMKDNQLEKPLEDLLKDLNRKNFSNLSKIGSGARKLIMDGNLSEGFREEIIEAYHYLGDKVDLDVAVRSSATAEDLPEASFAGQHDTFLNIRGDKALLNAVKECFASLYTDRAIKYREDKGFLHNDVALSVGVQMMVRSDKACSGVGFTIEPESGFENVILLSGVWGLGENIVQGTVTPDEFYVFKPTLSEGKNAIVDKKLGDKTKTMIYASSNGHSSLINIETEEAKQNQFVLSDEEV